LVLQQKSIAFKGFYFVLKVVLPTLNMTNLSEVPEAFRPTEWLSEVIPRKAPYYPQMGDEVMYFRQGHQLYLNAVRAKNMYEVGPRSEPWARQTIRVSQKLQLSHIKYDSNHALVVEQSCSL